MPHVQARIIRQTCLLPLSALTALTATVTILCRKVIAEAAEYEAVLPHLELLLLSILLLTATMAAAILYVAFRFSHRVTGPSYRIIETLKAAPGDLDIRARLRKGDFLGEIADQLNVTLGLLQQRVDGDRAGSPPCEVAAAKVEEAVAVPEPVGAGAESDC